MGQMSPQKSLCVLCELRDLCGWIRSSSLSKMKIIVTTDRTLLANHSNRNTAHPDSCPPPAHEQTDETPSPNGTLERGPARRAARPRQRQPTGEPVHLGTVG